MPESGFRVYVTRECIFQMTRPLTLDELTALSWDPRFERLDDGTYQAIIAALPGFKMYGPEAELRSEWRGALRGLLATYQARGKAIPLPRTQRVVSAEPVPAERDTFLVLVAA